MTESLPVAATGPEVGCSLETHVSELAVVFELGAVVVSEGLFVKAAAFVVAGAFGAEEDGPGAEAETSAEPGPDVLGRERGWKPPPEVAGSWNSRAERLLACEAACKTGPRKSQEHPPGGLRGATGHCRLGSPAEGMPGKGADAAGALLGSGIVLQASRPGEETGPGGTLVGKMAVGGTWS